MLVRVRGPPGETEIRSVVALCNPARDACLQWSKDNGDCGQGDLEIGYGQLV